jgi:hypothetical protein
MSQNPNFLSLPSQELPHAEFVVPGFSDEVYISLQTEVYESNAVNGRGSSQGGADSNGQGLYPKLIVPEFRGRTEDIGR